MSQKPGRNDPCPCGSGKKYKKCCGAHESFAPIIPESERTGTPYDDYMEVMSLLGLFGQKILRFEEDGRELKKAVSDFEKRFRPGEPEGLTNSLYMSWMHFDLRFGPNRETIAERSLADPLTAHLVEPGPTLLRRMAESYLTFYEVIKAEDDDAVLRELGTDQRWTVLHVRKLTETEAVPGEIWYTRLVGPAEEALSYTTPFVFDPGSKAQFERAVRIQERDFSAGPRADLFPRERHFAESQKEAVLFWAEFIFRGLTADMSDLSEPPGMIEIDDLPAGSLPFLVNTDREEVVFAEMKFRVKDEAALRKRLAALKSFEYDAENDSWTWLKVGDRKDPEDARTIRGTFQVKDGFLVAETNSRERAARLKAKLKNLLGSLIAYDGTRWRDQNDLPELSEEEKEASRRESQELNSRPEIREALQKHQEHYYFKKWPHEKIPALGGIMPIEAAKTETGRRKLKDLIEFYERTQNAARDEAPRLDFDRLRRMLGLPPKAN
jgi:hypothetical protein